MLVWLRFYVIDTCRTGRLDNLTSVNKVLPEIAGDWYRTPDGMTAVSDLDQFPAATAYEHSGRFVLLAAMAYATSGWARLRATGCHDVGWLANTPRRAAGVEATLPTRAAGNATATESTPTYELLSY